MEPDTNKLSVTAPKFTIDQIPNHSVGFTLENSKIPFSLLFSSKFQIKSEIQRWSNWINYSGGEREREAVYILNESLQSSD